MTDEVRASLEGSLRQQLGDDRRIVSFEQSPSAYRTSAPLEVLDVGLDDGSTLKVMFKDVGRASLSETVRRVKPDFLHDPAREIEVYRQVLASAELGTARYYGADRERGWLFVEKVRGVELFQVGEPDTWAEVARWVARLHEHFRARAEAFAVRARLLRYDRDLFRRWFDRARRNAEGSAGPLLDRLAGSYERVVEELAALPASFIHGELYASNVIVDRTKDGLRVCPVDWELAAVGPGALDLAALTAGGWGETEREAIEAAYREAGGDAPERALDLCRLHLSIQWLGWSSDWRPPAEHDHDWVTEGERLAARLGL